MSMAGAYAAVRRSVAITGAIMGAIVFAIVLTSCARRAPPDIAPSTTTLTYARATRADVPPKPELAVTGWRVVSLAVTRALATDEDHVYFGDETTRALYDAPKVGGPPVAIGVPAPRDIALGPGSIVWIGAPGNVVVRAARTGGPGEVIRDRGDFTAIAAEGADVYVAELTGKAGTLTRITGPTATQVAVFDSPPRAIVMDATDVFVQTSRTIVRVTRATGDVAVVLAGAALSRLALDAEAVYTTDVRGPSRALVRVPRAGGYGAVIERAVRDAPIAVLGGEAFYLKDDLPMLRRVSARGGASTIVASAPELERVSAMVIDESGIFVGSESAPQPGRGDVVGGAVIAMPVVPLPRAPP
ncbi:MAG: hypothetical protein JWP87_2483 [Labilithrix sp.]|nr:hypothetical protein [Labilithrix sp.]